MRTCASAGYGGVGVAKASQGLRNSKDRVLAVGVDSVLQLWVALYL